MLSREDRTELMMKEYGELSTQLIIRSLRDRYTAEDVPPCRVCCRPLSVQAMGGGAPTIWACVGSHYDKSIFEQRRTGDGLVLELLKRFERLADQGRK